jgi:hypothetical protein
MTRQTVIGATIIALLAALVGERLMERHERRTEHAAQCGTLASKHASAMSASEHASVMAKQGTRDPLPRLRMSLAAAEEAQATLAASKGPGCPSLSTEEATARIARAREEAETAAKEEQAEAAASRTREAREALERIKDPRKRAELARELGVEP